MNLIFYFLRYRENSIIVCLFNQKNLKGPFQTHSIQTQTSGNVSAVVFLRRSDGGLSHCRFKLDSRPVHVEFVVNQVALERFL